MLGHVAKGSRLRQQEGTHKVGGGPGGGTAVRSAFAGAPCAPLAPSPGALGATAPSDVSWRGPGPLPCAGALSPHAAVPSPGWRLAEMPVLLLPRGSARSVGMTDRGRVKHSHMASVKLLAEEGRKRLVKLRGTRGRGRGGTTRKGRRYFARIADKLHSEF